jgi:pimeloyl-ACP methyl ester carboxylesterase
MAAASPRQHQPLADVRFVEANGLRFGFLEWGQGPLVLLFHGFPDTAHTWDVLGPKIAAEGFRVVAPFMRGYAPTSIPTRDATSRDLGEDVVALIDALGASKATIIGHDWGAEAVYAAIGLAPEKIEKLVTVAVPHRASLKPTLKIAWGLRHFAVLSLPGAAARFSQNDYATAEHLCRRWSPTWKLTPADLEPVKNAFAAPGAMHAALGYYRAAAFLTPPFMKSPTRLPGLCVWGTDDPALGPADFEGTRPFFKGGLTIAPIRGGHFCHRESPGSALDAIIPFLKVK